MLMKDDLSMSEVIVDIAHWANVLQYMAWLNKMVKLK